MPRNRKKTIKVRRPGPAQMRVGIKTMDVEVTGLDPTVYKPKPERRHRGPVQVGISVGTKGASVRRAKA